MTVYLLPACVWRCIMLCAGLICLPFSALAQEGTFIAYESSSFIRASGVPVAQFRTFTVKNPATSYTLLVHNGGMSTGVSSRVASAEISLNGVKIIAPRHLNKTLNFIQTVVQLESENELAVTLSGQPGSAMTIQVMGVDNDPPLIISTIDPLANANGWHQSDLSVSFRCDDKTSRIVSCSATTTVVSEVKQQTIFFI